MFSSVNVRSADSVRPQRQRLDFVGLGFFWLDLGHQYIVASEYLAFELMSVSEGGVATPGGCQACELDRGLLSSRSVGSFVSFELDFDWSGLSYLFGQLMQLRNF